jgi:hypothetical protein
MAHYVVSYDLHHIRNYHPVWIRLESWGATRLLESLWVLNSNLSAGQIRDELRVVGDNDDSFAVIELKTGSWWATAKARTLGTQWLQQNIMA